MRCGIASDTSHPGGGGTASVRYARTRYTLFALLFAAVLAFIDRQLLNILVTPIRADIGIDDVRFSLLQGAAFGVVYALMTFPVAYLSDRFSRKMILMASVAAWSVMALLFGLANSFGMLLLARMGLAIGEAGLSPAEISIVRQIYPPERQSFAVAILTLSVYLGGGLSMVIGGPALEALQVHTTSLPWGLAPWRLLFVACASLGLLGLLFLAFMPEPQRTPQPRVKTSLRAFGQVIWDRRVEVGSYLAAFAGIQAVIVGVMAWTPAIFMRTHGWSAQSTGLAYGLVFILGGMAGALSGGRLVGLLMKRGRASAVPDLACVATVLLGVAIIAFGLVPDGRVALAFAGVAMIAVGALLALGAYGLQAMLPAIFSARAVALYFLVPSTLGASFGPSAVPLIAGMLPGKANLGTGLAIMASVMTLWSLIWLSILIRSRRGAA